MRLQIIHPGILATVQDGGRPLMRRYGVPTGGAADRYAFRLVNAVLGNDPACAVTETAGSGFQAVAQEAGVCAWIGPGSQLLVNGEDMQQGRAFHVTAGARIEIRGGGNYQYLAVRGGWQVAKVLGSSAYCRAGQFGGGYGRPLQKNDLLHAPLLPISFHKQLSWYIAPRFLSPLLPSDSPPVPFPAGVYNAALPEPKHTDMRDAPFARIRLLRGPEYDEWPAAAVEALTHYPAEAGSRRDRVGIQLHTPADLRHPAPGKMWSAGITVGAMQIPPDGHPFVLLSDAQTTGGYPRIAQVAAADLPLLVRLPVRAKIVFEWIDPEEAFALLANQEKQIECLAQSCRLALGL